MESPVVVVIGVKVKLRKGLDSKMKDESCYSECNYGIESIVCYSNVEIEFFWPGVKR